MSTDKEQLIFGDRLRHLREQAGFTTGREFAGHLAWVASKVSRIETGRTLPADSDLTVWLESVSAPDHVTIEVRDQLRDLRLARARWKHQLRTGHTPRQERGIQAERAASRITMVEFFLVPGLVQTADYARAVFQMAARLHSTPHDTEDAVRARIRRQDVVWDSTKRIELLVSEVALRYPICPATLLRAQIERLISVSALTNVRLGVIPTDAVLPTLTMHGYVITDDTVDVEVNHTEITVTDPDDVALYRRLTDELWTVALEGDDARALLARIVAALQQ